MLIAICMGAAGWWSELVENTGVSHNREKSKA